MSDPTQSNETHEQFLERRVRELESEVETAVAKRTEIAHVLELAQANLCHYLDAKLGVGDGSESETLAELMECLRVDTTFSALSPDDDE